MENPLLCYSLESLSVHQRQRSRQASSLQSSLQVLLRRNGTFYLLSGDKWKQYMVATNITDAIQEIYSFMVLKTDVTAFDITVR